MHENKTITGLIVGVGQQDNGVVLLLEQDNGERTDLRFTSEEWAAAFNNVPLDLGAFSGRRIRWDGEKITFLDAANAKPLFFLGRVVATPGALQALQDAEQTPASFILRHVAGDWGQVCDEDRQANDEALKTGERLLSVYRTAKGVKLWIITEAADDDGRREATTLLLPEEY